MRCRGRKLIVRSGVLTIWWNWILRFRAGFGLVIPLAHNADMMERALVSFAIIVPRPCIADFTVGNRRARR